MIGGAAYVRDGFRAYFSQRAILRSYLLIPCALAVALIVTWPQDTLAGVLRGGPATDCFTVAAVCLLAFVLYLGARYGSEDYAPDALGSLREYVTLTPASIASLVAGKAAFAVLHTAFLLSLGAPFLVAALGVSGAAPGALLRSLAVLAAASLGARMYGLLLLCLLGERRLLRGGALFIGLAVYLLVTWLALPALSPAAALVRGDPAASRLDVLATLGAALLMAAASGLVLSSARRRARAGSRHGE
jgi:hypothetical protein